MVFFFYERIMVLDNGSIVEFDQPRKLLTNKEGFFYSLVNKSGLI
jgi:ABC-type multidrug transport system fused ATPase/permease subunit